MFRGIAAVMAACLIWGLIYVVPELMPAFSPFEISIGRYICYGLISTLYMLAFRRHIFPQLTKKIWKTAFLFGFLANVGCYPFIVVSMRYANPAVSALILGMSPIAIALYGNWKQRACSYATLLWPCLAMAGGLFLANWPALQESSMEGSIFYYILGLFFAFIALATWTIYAVANSQVLKENEHLDPIDWCSVIGIATFAWTVALSALLIICMPSHHLHKFMVWTPELQTFILGNMVLGFLCSWIAFNLWNKGSGLLPVFLVGQLTIFETIFGLIFVYFLQNRMPVLIELAGIVVMLAGICVSIHLFNTTPASVKDTEI
jgi:drug/metabolite transporter (DMT)-like permease